MSYLRNSVVSKIGVSGFDLIVEMAAHINLNSDTEMLAREGKIAVVGNRAETNIDARNLMRTEGSIFGMSLLIV